MKIEPQKLFRAALESAAIPKRIENVNPVSRGIYWMENVFLLIIALFTVIAMAQEIVVMARAMSVQLKDLLLMFIYVEVLGMVGVYYNSHKIPITLPLFIAITALARLVILQGKDQPPVNLLYEGAAILLLALACVVLTWRGPSTDDKDGGPVQ
jgi:protein PsiE